MIKKKAKYNDRIIVAFINIFRYFIRMSFRSRKTGEKSLIS